LRKKYDCNNGILLSATLHKLFDKYLLSLDDDGYVVFSKNILNNDAYKNYHGFNGIKTKLSKKVMHNMKIHYECFMKGV
jgi:hypothetical protein